VRFKIENVNAVGASIENAGLSISHHSERVHRVFESVLVKYFTLLIAMHEYIFADSRHTHKNEGVSERYRELENLMIAFIQFDLKSI
jgi:hypothetical protein